MSNVNEKNLILTRAQAAVLSHDFSTAARLYKQLLRDDPSNVDYLKELGLIYVKNGEDAKAIPYYEQIITFYPHYVEAMNSLGAIYRRLKRYEESIVILQKALDEDRQTGSVNYNLGFTYKEMGNYDDAIEAFEIVISENPSDVLAYNHLGKIYYEKKDYQKSISSYKRGLQVDQNHPILNYNLAVCYDEAKMYPDAIRCYEAALKARPGWVDAIRDFSNLLISCQQNKEASDLVHRSIELHPNDPQLLCLLGRIYLNQFDYDSAVKTFKKAQFVDENNIQVLSGLAEALEKGEKPQEALDSVVKAMEIDPDNKDVKKQYIHTLLSAEEYDAAQMNVQDMYEDGGDKDIQVLDLYEQYCICVKDEENAKNYYDQIVKMNKHYKNHILTAAQRYVQIGDNERAEKKAKEFVAREIRNPAGYNMLGKIYTKNGDLQSAIDSYEKSRKLREPNILADKQIKKLQSQLSALPVEENEKIPVEEEKIEEQPVEEQVETTEVDDTEKRKPEDEFDFDQLGGNIPMEEALLEDEEEFFDQLDKEQEDDDELIDDETETNDKDDKSNNNVSETHNGNKDSSDEPYNDDDDLTEDENQNQNNKEVPKDNSPESEKNNSNNDNSEDEEENSDDDFDFGQFDEKGLDDDKSAFEPEQESEPEYENSSIPESSEAEQDSQPQMPAENSQNELQHPLYDEQPQMPPQNNPMYQPPMPQQDYRQPYQPQYQQPQMPYQPQYQQPMYQQPQQMQQPSFNPEAQQRMQEEMMKSSNFAMETALNAQKLAQKIADEHEELKNRVKYMEEHPSVLPNIDAENKQIDEENDTLSDASEEFDTESASENILDDNLDNELNLPNEESPVEENSDNEILPEDNSSAEIVSADPLIAQNSDEIITEEIPIEQNSSENNADDENSLDFSDEIDDNNVNSVDITSCEDEINLPDEDDTDTFIGNETLSEAETESLLGTNENDLYDDDDEISLSQDENNLITEDLPSQEINFPKVSEFISDDTVKNEEELQNNAENADNDENTENADNDVAADNDEIESLENEIKFEEAQKEPVENLSEPEDISKPEDIENSNPKDNEAVSLLPKIEKIISDETIATENEPKIGVFKKLLSLSDYLPDAEKTEFMTGKPRMQMEYLIAKMSGKPGLLKTSQSLIKSGVLGETHAEKTDDSDFENGVSNESLRKVITLMKKLSGELQDQNLAKALCNSADSVLEKIELEDRKAQIF